MPREASQRTCDHALGVLFRNADTHLTRLVHLAHTERGFRRFDGAMRVGLKPFAHAGKADRAMTSFEQARTDGVLQLTQLQADRRL